MRMLRALLILWLTASAVPAQLDFPGAKKFGKKPVRARLVLSYETAKPGDTIVAGVELTMDAEWHTYWRNPGLGIETKIKWTLPPGISADEIQWPVPITFTTAGTVQYGYKDRVVLLVPLHVANSAATGPTELSAAVSWLQCDPTTCVPASENVRATLTIGNQSKANTDETNLFAQAQQRLPSNKLPGSATAKWDEPGGVTNRAFVVEWNTSATEPDFFPYTNALAEISTKTSVLANSGSNVVLRKTAKAFESTWPKEVAGLLVRKEGDSLAGYEVTLPIHEIAMGNKAMAGGATSIWWVFLIYAFAGGLILNIMPCVLPVIALKILGFVSQSREHPRRVRQLGVLYTFGVLASFLVLAGIVIAVQATGKTAGWGMQFGNPEFIVVLTVIVTLVALNLFGLFEVTLSGRAMGAAGEAASRHGSAGAFMNGVLATALATPCTAPLLGTALGFAFTQSAAMIVLFFLTIGFGLALPYLLLSFKPAWLKFLPKPGAWMERFKIAMGFPMLATAVWLFSLTITHYGKRVWWLGAFLVVVAMAAWIFGEFVQRGRTRRGLSLVIALGLLVGGYAFAVENKLRWREPVVEGASEAETFQERKDGLVWRRWSAANVAKFRAEGRPILVDFTADWCVTCNTIVKPALESASVRAKMKEINAVALLADNTTFPPEISAELQKFGRAGVPMVLVYPRDASKPAVVLPEALTAGMVVKALEDAVK